MTFPPRSLPNLTPAGYSQPGFQRPPIHPLFPQQAYGLYGVEGTSAYISQAQPRIDCTPYHAPHLVNVDPALPSQEQPDSAHGGDTQSAFTLPAAPMPPPARPRKRKAATLRLADWEPHKDRILQLHVEEQKPLSEVREIMKGEGFEAEVRQYRTRISQWKMDKNVKTKEMQAIVRKRQRRKIVEPSKGELVFTVRGTQVLPQKIERWMKRHNVVDSSIGPVSPAASTPSAVGCRTASERGSPALISTPSPAVSISSQGGVYLDAQSPQMPSPALSISSIVRSQSSTFTGQSPTLAHLSLPNVHSGFFHAPGIFQIQMDVDARPLYKQDEEERLRTQILHAQSSAGTSTLEYSETSGSSDPLYKLGDVLLEQGRYKAAEEVIHMLVKGHQDRTEHEDSVEALDALALLGRVLWLQGLHTKAQRLIRRVLEGSENLLGPEHPSTLSSVDDIGSLLGDQGKFEEAEVMHQRGLQGKEKVLGPEHPDTLTSVINLGSVFEKQGKDEEAEAMYRRALEGRKKVLGLWHPRTVSSVAFLRELLMKQGRHEEAESVGL